MNLRVLALGATFLLACGGSEIAGGSADSSAGPTAADGAAKGTGSSTGEAIGADATLLTMTTGVLGEARSEGSTCGASDETITIDLGDGTLTHSKCKISIDAGAPADAGPSDLPASSLVVVEERTLTSTELASVRTQLAGYSTTAAQPKNECGYDGTAFELDLANASNVTTKYWDEAYNCNYPADIVWVTPSLQPLFSALSKL